MSRIAPVIKREFTEAVGSKAFLIGTILGPLLIVAMFAAQFLIVAKSGGGTQHIVLVDATGANMGEALRTSVEQRTSRLPSFMARATYELEVEALAGRDTAALTEQLRQRVLGKQIDGFLWLSSDVVEAGSARYEGSNATNSQVTSDLRQAVQRVVQTERLRREGIDESRLGEALAPVELEVSKTGEGGAVGNPRAALLLAFGMAFSIYIVVIMYGQSIMSSVQEEKRDRIVELIVSSIRSRDLLLGKVLGIGGAGVLQMVIWVATAAVALTYGGAIAAAVGASESTVETLAQSALFPQVPLSLGVVFVLYFAGGFLLFATLFAVVGAIVTNAQEAQQLVLPVLMPFVLGLFIAMPAAENPGSTAARVGSLLPFTSPMVMPVRAAVEGVQWGQFLLSLLLLYGTAVLILWLAAKIYRVAIFATGTKPTGREILRWMRAA